MRILFLSVLLAVFAYGGWLYESELPVIVLDGKVVEVINTKADGSMETRPIKPLREDYGTCPSCQHQGKVSQAAPRMRSKITQLTPAK